MPRQLPPEFRQRALRIPLRSAGGDEFDLESFAVLEERRVVVGSAGPWVPVGIELRPAMIRRGRPQGIHLVPATRVKGQVTQSRSSAVIGPGLRRALNYEIARPKPPAPTIGPLLEGFATKLPEQPAPRIDSGVKIVDTQFDVVDQFALAHLDILRHGANVDCYAG